MKHLAWLLLLASGCTCAAPAPVSTGAAGASVAASAPAPSASARQAATEPPAACDFRWGYHGTLAGQEVFARLEQTPGALAGRYFYAKVGVDLPLAGTIDGAGAFELVEGDPRKPTGHFTGTCHAESGVLDGTWSNAGRSSPFHLERVGPRAAPLVAVKRLTLARKAKTVGTYGGTACKYEQKTVELFGLGSPEVERVLGHQGARDLAPPILMPDEHEMARACDSPGDASAEETVVSTFRGLITIERAGTSMVEGAAHPNNAVDFSRVTYDVATGHPVTARELFTRFPEALLRRCVAAYASDPELELGNHDLEVMPQGVHLFGDGYPHYARSLVGRGPILTWAALLGEGVLRADSPARRAWEGVAPGKPGDAECLFDEGPAFKVIRVSPPAHAR